jgi:TonB-linked SusC/RagA family outer membrane protein
MNFINLEIKIKNIKCYNYMNKKMFVKRNALRKIITVVCVLCCTFSLYAQKIITGTVTDVYDEPLSGVSVSVKGTSTGAVTDAQGTYRLNVPENATLVFSYIGYVTQEVAVNSQTTVSVKLAEDMQSMDEVVIVGYGVQKKMSLTGSVATVSAKEIQNIPVSNLTAALSGRLSGVSINQFTGSPGTSSSLSIRAKGTWNNADPLYVIDGVVRDKFAFDGLNANDVENISILKDGASAAVYGSRAANGVVLVSTRKGVIGKPVITYNGSIGVSSATKIPTTQNAYNQAVLINDRYDQEGNLSKDDTRYFTPDELEYFKTHNWSWLDESLRDPVVNHHSLNVAGGNERVRYFIGGSYHYETGIFDNINHQQYNLRGNIEANISKNLVASLNLNMDHRLMRRSEWRYDAGNNTQYDLFKALLMRTGQVPPYVNGLPVGLPFVEWHPLEIIAGSGGYDRKKYGNYDATLSLQYNIPGIEGLSVKVLYNQYNTYYFRKEFRLPYAKYKFQTTGGHGHILDLENPTVVGKEERNDGNMLQQRQEMGENYQLNGFITYDRTFGKHNISALFVYEQAEGTYDWFQAERQNYVTDIIDQLNAGGTTNAVFPTGSGSEDGRLSYIGRVNYGYDDKYLFEAAFRYDGSVKFAPDKRWGFFPSVSLAWRVSKENFFKNNVSFVNDLKLRGSIASLGNDAVGGWQWGQRYNMTNGQQFGVTTTGIEAGAIPNPYITWEKSVSYEGGLDAAFLNNKIVLGFNGFYRHTYDILGSRLAAMPTTFGASMPSENYATIDTKGFELELTYNGNVGEVNYYAKGNLGYAVNKLIYQDEAENLRPYQSKIGLNTDIADGFIATDIIRTQADLDALPEGYTIFGSKPELGMLNYKDLRGPNSDEPDGVINDSDKTWIRKHTLPPVNYGFGVGGSWKNISLDLYFQGVGKYDVMLTGGSGSRGINARQVETNLDFWTDHWTINNPNASMPRVYNNQANNENTFWMKNGAYLRLKNIVLSYELPKKIIEKLKIGQFRIFLEGQNLFLLQDHVKWFDPELGNTGNNAYLYPITKTYSFGINLTL